MLIIRLSVFFIFLGSALNMIFSCPLRINHKLLYFLRQPNEFVVGTSLGHFPNHDFKFANTIVVNFAEIVHLNNAIFLKCSHSSRILCFNYDVIGQNIIA